jgi:hypothetical protein
MSDNHAALAAALADRYTLEGEVGQGGMASELAAQSRGSADVAKATLAHRWLRLCAGVLALQRSERHFSDISRAVASATSVP